MRHGTLYQGLMLFSLLESKEWLLVILSYLNLGAICVVSICVISAGMNAHGTTLLLDNLQRFPLGQNTSLFTPTETETESHTESTNVKLEICSSFFLYY